jgi:hypothetical protein
MHASQAGATDAGVFDGGEEKAEVGLGERRLVRGRGKRLEQVLCRELCEHIYDLEGQMDAYVHRRGERIGAVYLRDGRDRKQAAFGKRRHAFSPEPAHTALPFPVAHPSPSSISSDGPTRNACHILKIVSPVSAGVDHAVVFLQT